MAELSESIQLLISKLYAWVDQIVLSIPNLILLFITLFIGMKLIKIVRKLIRKISSRKIVNIGVQNLVNNIAAVILYLVLLLLLLTILGLKGPITTILASAGVMGLAVGLALQDPLMNLFSGVIMSLQQIFNIGDFIETNGYVGAVQEVSLKSTIVRTLSGEEVSIPNKMVLQNPVKNFTTNGVRRVEVVCGISYGEDLKKVKQLVLDAIRPMAIDTVERPVEFIYTSFGDSSINFQLRFWTNPESVWHFLEAKSNAIIKIKEVFDEHNVVIPFPIRTLDFGIKGGENLSKMLSDK